MQIEILLIGNELLIGKIKDDNGYWISQQVTAHGIQISRMTVIPDNVMIIATTIQEIFQRKPDYLITSGGLGPTFDDMTLEGVCQAMTPPQSLIENSQALEFIWERYRTRFPEQQAQLEKFLEQKFPSYRKMAKLPAHSTPLHNREGSAPGVYIASEFTNRVTKIICLPGVPAELRCIFLDHILPELVRQVPDAVFHQCGFIFKNLGESRFTSFITQIKDEYPEIWIKTHPRRIESLGGIQYEVELHLTSFSCEKTISIQMNDLYQRLKGHILGTNGIILEEHPLE